MGDVKRRAVLNAGYDDGCRKREGVVLFVLSRSTVYRQSGMSRVTSHENGLRMSRLVGDVKRRAVLNAGYDDDVSAGAWNVKRQPAGYLDALFRTAFSFRSSETGEVPGLVAVPLASLNS